MSTHVGVRLPIVEATEADLATAGALPLDGDAAEAVAVPPAGRVWPFGLRSASVEVLVRLAADLVALGVPLALLRPHPSLAVLWVLTILATFAATGLYEHRLRMSALDDVPAIFIGSALGLAAMSLATGPVLLRAAVGAAVAGTLVVLARAGAYLLIRHWRSRGVLLRRTVLVGTRSRADQLVARIEAHPETGLRVRGVLGARPAGPGAFPISGSVTDLPYLISSGAVDTVIVGDASSKDERRVLEALRTCETATEIFVLPRLSELSTTADDEVWGVPLHRLKQRRSRTRMAVKRGTDVAMASAALLVAGPVIAMAALAVRLEMGRGVIYRQERVGLGGRRFQLLKLRSMHNVAAGTTAAWATDADRVGRVGAFIRRYSIDELPQLWNVIRGDMSLVGPRPERPEYVDQFGHEFPSYSFRHRVMVGLTGLAAVEGLRGDTSIADRAYFDNWYIENWSLWLDVKIMVRTASALLKGTGSH